MSKQIYTTYIKEYSTDIPIIQRDYVQGSDANAEKREGFLKVILDNLAGRLTEEKGGGNLDFIYGTAYENESEADGFMPIDGQQRLTTLALIGWLLAQKSNSSKYKMPELRYRTRHTTEQFCNQLRNYTLPENYGNLRHHLLTEPIWLAERWVTDPSVSAMIDLLDAVDLKLKSAEYKDCVDDMARRFFEDNPISFYLLDMNNPLEDSEEEAPAAKTDHSKSGFRLSEDLYIKMNARGKLLTPFENWKAQFTGMLESRFGGVIYEYNDIEGQKFTIPEYFSYAIEHEWTEFLWPRARMDWEKLTPEEQKEHAYPRVDEYFMKLLDYITEVVYWESFSDEESALRTKRRMNRYIDEKLELSDIFSGRKNQWLVKRRITVYRNYHNLISLFRMFDTMVRLSAGEGVIGLNSFFNSILYHGDWKPDSELICVSEDKNTDDNIRFTSNLVELCLDPAFTDVWNTPLKMLLWSIMKFAIRYPAGSTDQLLLYSRTIWGWEQAQRQRVVKGMGVRFNLRLEDYPLLRDVTDCLLENPDTDVALGAVTLQILKKLRLIGEYEKRDYRNKGFGKELAVLGNSPYLKGDFSNVYEALEKFRSLYPESSFIEKFIGFVALDNTTKIIKLVGLGYEGIRTYPHTDRYRFYGSDGHWDYVFASTDLSFRKAFTGVMCGEQPLALSPDTALDYYICEYPDFISVKIGDNKRGYYLYSNNAPYEMTALTGRYSARPMNGYNRCPYAYTVIKLLSKEIVEKFKLTDWGYGTVHARMFIGEQRYSLECRQKGWLWRNENNSSKWMKKWSSRFSITPEGWMDKEGEFLFEGNYLLQSNGRDRIQTAVSFVQVLYELTLKNPNSE